MLGGWEDHGSSHLPCPSYWSRNGQPEALKPGPKSRDLERLRSLATISRCLVENGAGLAFLVATHADSTLPEYLSMTWVCIECVCQAFSVLKSVNIESEEPLLYQGRDFAHRFKILRFADSELCKACVYFLGAFYVDVGEQMGWLAIANVEQRKKLLISTAAINQTDTSIKRLLDQNAFLAPLAAWTRDSMSLGDLDQYMDS